MVYIIPGRAYSPEQKRAIIERLYKAWLDAPTLRLGQLIYIGTSLRDLFSVEDEAMITTLEECIIPRADDDIAPIPDAMLRLAESDVQS